MKSKVTNKIIEFIKNEVVLVIALILGLISALINRPSMEYLNYIDFRVLVLLYALMMVVAGLKSLGAFKLLGEKLVTHTSNLLSLVFILIALCFFSSMLITNDVALITFVPFTISILMMTGFENKMIPVIVLETIAANLGSMLTPIGNPQNLLLFSKGNMEVASFIRIMLAPTIVSFALIMVMTFINVKKDKIKIGTAKANTGKLVSDFRFWVYVILFFVCLGNVFHLYSYWYVFGIVTIVVFVSDRSLFKQVDYSLLFTFVGFFVFIGNMKHIESFTNWVSGVVTGNELEVGIISSQVISNVPAAMLLSGFTSDYERLLLGVNLGGLGTLIASMASLISYRFYVKEYPQKKGSYFKTFTFFNFMLLLTLYLIFKFI